MSSSRWNKAEADRLRAIHSPMSATIPSPTRNEAADKLYGFVARDEDIYESESELREVVDAALSEERRLTVERYEFGVLELRRLIGLPQPDGESDEEQQWSNHPEWADGELILIPATVGELRNIRTFLDEVESVQ